MALYLTSRITTKCELCVDLRSYAIVVLDDLKIAPDPRAILLGSWKPSSTLAGLDFLCTVC